MPSSTPSDRRKGSKPKPQAKPKPRQPPKQQKLTPSNGKSTNKSSSSSSASSSPIDFDTPIPLPLQQLILDVFRSALLPNNPAPDATATATGTADEELDTKSLIQTIKAHLYQRDFDSAFTEAGEDLLRAYALRWSAARALGYAGLFRGVLAWMKGCQSQSRSETNIEGEGEGGAGLPENSRTRVVCIGGGAGAEIVALAAAWRSLGLGRDGGVESALEPLSLEERSQAGPGSGPGPGPASVPRGLSVAAVDIADWTGVVQRLEKTIASSAVPTLRSSEYQPPLVPSESVGDGDEEGKSFSVSFQRSDVLGVSEDGLKDVLLDTSSSSLLVTLMFTLNELFSTSMAKTTGLLLRMSDILPSNAVLLVVDSPGSYSTLKMGKDKDGAPVERNYPMKFLLDHTLLSVAEGKWERIYTQDSRWWRRDAERLRYQVGEGAGLEDMRFQLHLYRRL